MQNALMNFIRQKTFKSPCGQMISKKASFWILQHPLEILRRLRELKNVSLRGEPLEYDGLSSVKLVEIRFETSPITKKLLKSTKNLKRAVGFRKLQFKLASKFDRIRKIWISSKS